MVGLILAAGLLAGCSIGSTQCDKGAEPETVILDATSYVEEGSTIEVCFRDDVRGGDFCNEPGSEPVIMMSFQDEYPETLRYDVTRIIDGSRFIGLAGGEYEMQCEEQVVRIEVGKLEPDA